MSNSFFSLGLIGYPLLQSLSPSLHAAALERMGLMGEYRLYPIPPLPESETLLGETIAHLRTGQIQGLNVTIPHKQAVIPYLDHLTPQAHAIGAVNTIYCKAGVLYGDNTDAPGFTSDLRRVLAGIDQLSETAGDGDRQRNALVLGAGGAARAVVYSLWQAGWQVTVAARRPEQAADLVASLRQSAIVSDLAPNAFATTPLDTCSITDFVSFFQSRESIILTQKVGIIVNASSAGMFPDISTCPWPEDLPLPQGWLVYDLVYKPPETSFMRRARAAGLPAVNGLGMLVEQAALALERWTGLSVPRQAMMAVVGQSLDRGIS